MKNWLINLLGGYTRDELIDNKPSLGEYSSGFSDGYAQGYKMASPPPAPLKSGWVFKPENESMRKAGAVLAKKHFPKEAIKRIKKKK